MVDEDTLGLAGMVLDQRAQFLLQQDRLSEAEMAWREAVKVAEQLHGEEGEQTLVVKNSLATLLSMAQAHFGGTDYMVDTGWPLLAFGALIFAGVYLVGKPVKAKPAEA